MKTMYVLLALGASALGSPPTLAHPPSGPAYSHPVNRVEHLERETIQRGATVHEVLANLGQPARKLTANLWAYPNYSASTEQVRNDGCTVLLVTMRDGVVTDLQLVNGRAEAVLAKRANTPSPMLAQAPAPKTGPGS